MTVRAMELGTAGEHIVCADLLIAGYRATMAGAGMPYDVLVDVAGVGVLRVAVKATQHPKPRPGRDGSKRRYSFHTTRPQLRSSGEKRRPRYERGDMDILAFVALDIRRVGYAAFPEVQSFFWVEADTPQPTSRFAHPRGELRSFDSHTFDRALRVLHAR